MKTAPTAHAHGPSAMPKMAFWGLLGLILFFALTIRMDDLLAWRQVPHKAFLDGRPLLISFDGYFYLSLARDLQDKAYRPTDPLRGVPDSIGRPPRPPLISLLAAGIGTLAGISLDWAGVLLPPLLGVLLAVPLVLFGRLYAGPLMALIAAFVGLFGSYYAYRSNLGWFDTDCMNVTFALTVAYLFIRFAMEPTVRRYGYLLGGGLCTAVFLLWWDQAAVPVLIISIAPLCIAAALFYRPRGKELWLAAGVTALVIVLLATLQGPQLAVGFLKKTTGLFGYIAKEQSGFFPNVGSSVFEQKPLAFADLVQKTTGNLPVFTLGILGLAWLLSTRARETAPLLILLLLGCFSFVYARRFLIFLNPFIALGVGFLFQRGWDARLRLPFLRAVVPIAAVLVCMAMGKDHLGKVYWPKETPQIAEGMAALSTISAEDAVVWAWWDHGYPIVYFGRRATINDGSVHSGLRTVCNAIPFSSSDPRYAAAFMHFYVSRGTRGIRLLFEALDSPAEAMALIRDVLTAGPERAGAIIARHELSPADHWLDFFFPRQPRPLYLFLDLRLARTTYWWHWFGSWDARSRNGRHAKFRLIRGLEAQGRRIRGAGIDVDVGAGVVTYKQQTYPMVRYLSKNGDTVTQTTYTAANGVVFAFRRDDGIGALMEPEFSATVFSRLFLLADAQAPYFTRVAERYPHYQVWRVASADRIWRFPIDPSLPKPPRHGSDNPHPNGN